MSWSPVSLIPPQFQNPTTKAPYSGAVLKAYAAGTDTAISMATTKSGATTVSTAVLNSSGYPETGGAVFIPHIDRDYKLCLYADADAAAADLSPIWSADNLSPILNSGAVTLNDATANSVVAVITATKTTSGTPSAGHGAGMDFVVETSADNNETGMQLQAVTTDVSAGSEDFDFVVKLMAAGATAAEVFRVKSTGVMTPAGDVLFAHANPEIMGGDTDGVMYIGPSTTNALGGVLALYGDTHATKAGDVELLVDGTARFHLDASNTRLDLGSWGLLTTGLVDAGSLKLATGATVTAILDEDNMVSDSATAVPTQQSVKAYADGLPTLASDSQTFNSSGTWNKPAGCTWVAVECIGGGGGGENITGAADASGGGGGEYAFHIFLASALGSTETVTIGAGGAGGADAGANVGVDGGDTTFGAHLTGRGGGGGGVASGVAGGIAGDGGGGAGSTNGAAAAGYAAGAGGYASDDGGGSTKGGGGGGGAASASSGNGGSSNTGGDGGDGVETSSTVGVAGTQPGGGGGASSNDGGGGAGGDGRCVVYSW